jgi:hypothetical protein
VHVTQATDYDLLGELCDASEHSDVPRPLRAPLVVRASDGRRVGLRTLA